MNKGFKGIDHFTNPSMEKSVSSIFRTITNQHNHFINLYKNSRIR